MKTYSITRTIGGRKIKFEVVKTGSGNVTPIFQFICPKCRSLLYEGAVTFDLEDEVKCSKCDHEAELWHFPHTLKGSGLYTMGGHYTNDALSILSLDEALDFFLWPWGTNLQGARFKPLVHGGGQPWMIGSLEQCLERSASLYDDLSPLDGDGGIVLGIRGDCGKDCLRCGLFRTFCPGCITRICLIAKCKRGTSYSGITYPKEICRLRRHCTSFDVIPKDLMTIEDMPKLRVRTKVELPRFVPVVRLTDKRSWFWDDLTLPWIVVRLAELVKDKALMQRVVSRGLHDFLGYYGRILLSTVMEDELLDALTPDDYVRMIKEIRPDATMTPDSYTYQDDPLCLSWEQTLKQAASSRAFSGLDMPVVGLVKGVIWKQIAWSTRKAIELGCRSFVIPSRELAELGLLDGMISAVTYALRKGKGDAQLLLYGLSYPFRGRGKFAYSGQSWLIGAKKGFYYKGNKSSPVTDAGIKSEECRCTACRGRTAHQLKDDIRSLALHNLLQTVGRFG